MKTPSSLSKLTIELSTFCNLACAGCPRTIGIANKEWENTHMHPDTFKSIVKNIPPTNMVTLHGIGEPTFHPEFISLVKLAKDSGKFGKIKITTNALLHPPSYYIDAFNAGLSSIWVSVDSLEKDLAGELRKNTDAEKLQSNLAELVKLGIKPEISMTVGSKNYRHINSTLLSLFSVGVKTIHMQIFQDYGDPSGIMSQAMLLEAWERLKRFKYLNQMNISLPKEIKHLQSTENRQNINTTENGKNATCSAPWARPAINVKGELTPCCTTFDGSLWGNQSLATSTYGEIWTSEAVQAWVQSYLSQQMHPICVGCALHPAYTDMKKSQEQRPFQTVGR